MGRRPREAAVLVLSFSMDAIKLYLDVFRSLKTARDAINARVGFMDRLLFGCKEWREKPLEAAKLLKDQSVDLAAFRESLLQYARMRQHLSGLWESLEPVKQTGLRAPSDW